MKKSLRNLTVFAIGLLLLSGSFVGADDKKAEKVVKIKGMMCSACETKVKEALLKVDGVPAEIFTIISSTPQSTICCS